MRVIVADDEILVRAVVVGTIPFEKLGLTLEAEASNGIEALELCRKHQPDILVTDIAMPGLTGLELIQEVKKIQPNIKIVIISGYSDFDYAKQAIRLGVHDYILKPVDEKEISRVLSNVKEIIIDERSRKEQESANKSQYQQVLPIILEKFMNELIQHNTYTVEFITNTLNSHGLHLNDPNFFIAVFSFDDPHLEHYRKDFTCFKKLTARFSKKYLNGILFQKAGSDNELVCIVMYKCRMHFDPMDAVPFMEREFSLYRRLIQKKQNWSVSIGISQPSNHLKRLPELYLQASRSLQESFWEGSGKLHRYSQSTLTEKLGMKISEKSIDDIALNIRLLNDRPALNYLGKLFLTLSVSVNVKPEEVKDLFWTFIQLLTGRLNLSLIFIQKESELFHCHPYEKLKKLKSMDELRCYMEEVIRRICLYYRVDQAISELDVIEKAKQMILKNLANDISLEQISGYVHLTPTYFSTLFKKETGMSYVDYKTTLRIEQAKNLLETTHMNLIEISSQVGYNDPKYFSKLYKKHTGSLPHQHRKKEFDQNK